MVRVKRGKVTRRRHKKVIKRAKGYRGRRSKIFSRASEALMHAGRYAWRDRRAKKREARALWNIRINAALRNLGTTYNQFIHALKLKKIELDRKILSDLAVNNPEVFEKIVEEVRK